jgi:arabinofuranosyltransferase
VLLNSRAHTAAATRDRAIVGLALTAFLAYSALFIYRTSFVIDGERYFSLFDDAMVSMRYARNLAEGFGIVWNAGERVEGYTNPLWMFYMALVHLLPIPTAKTSLIVQGTAAIVLAVNLLYVRRIALAISGDRAAVAWGAVLLTALYLPINFWSLQGMEVSLLVLVMSICAWYTLESLRTGTMQRRVYVLLAMATLVRPDMIVAFAAFLTFLLIADPAHRRRHAVWGGLLLIAAVAAQTGFRLWYYGDVLPNTYYLKMTGVPLSVRLARGGYVLLQFVWKANPLLFLLPAALALRRDRRIWLLLWILAAQVAYSVYVGGDAWEYWGGANRYISIAMPGFFVLCSYALYLFVAAFVQVLHSSAGPGARSGAPRARQALFGLALAYAIVCLNSIHGPGALREAALVDPPLHTGPGGGNQRDVAQALHLRAVTTPDATVAVMRAGTIPYFSARHSIDLLGKNDAQIAHGPAAAEAIGYLDFRPGHMKFDFAHSIGQRQPDVIVQLRRRTALAQPYLDGRYQDLWLDRECVYVRMGSPRIQWDRVPIAGCGEDSRDVDLN